MRKIKRALVSVSDKTNLEEFVKGLNKLNIQILSTGGTAKFIKGLGIDVINVSDYTGFPEMLDGRVKTLHPKIHAGLLSLRDKPEHMQQLKEYGIELIDMVVVNLYPFEKTVAKEGVKFEEAIENIDIGGPSMLRSASKNFRDVAVICNPARYEAVLKELNENNITLSQDTLLELATEVFALTNSYDRAIYEYLKSKISATNPGGKNPCIAGRQEKSKIEEIGFPDILPLTYKKAQDLRYGENPHQRGAFYKDESSKEPSISTARQLHGKELSFNNILDLNSALEIVKEFDEPAASIIKHTNPCGVACAQTLAKAYLDALECDKLSAFGSVVGFNREVLRDTAEAILTLADFVECIIAPSFSEDALALLTKRKNLRLLEVGKLGSIIDKSEYDIKKVIGGILVQDRDINHTDLTSLKVVTKKTPCQEELKSLLFGWRVVKHVRSNAIVLVNGTKTVGIGAGQMSRVDSVIISTLKAGPRARDSVMASDAFFPKEDAVQVAAKEGITSIIQPGGSIKDEDIIKEADKVGIAMVFTGKRHFRH